MKTLLLFSTALLITGSTGCFAMTYEDWRDAKFDEPDFWDEEISGEAADPDGDGRINYLEFGLNLDPMSPESGT